MPDTAKLLAWFLRLFGGVTACAIFATLLPTDWMDAAHAWLGLGRLPRAPLTEYLTRSIAGLYAIHGGLLLLASSDVRRYAPVITYLAIADGLFGFALIAIDIDAGLPWYWTAAEGPGVIVASAIILPLQAVIRRTSPPHAAARA